LFRFALFTAVAASSAAFATQRRALPPADPDWLTYRNERYAFRLSYPPASHVQTRREHGLQHIAISSNEPPEQQSATTGYHVDVLIYDRRLGHKLNAPCRELLREPHAVKVGKIQALRGTVQENDTADSSAVCVESKKLVVLIRATDDGGQATLANRILDTLRFGE
jgi:hypothetical protein